MAGGAAKRAAPPAPAINTDRMLSNTFAGSAPASVPTFILAQLARGTLAASCLPSSFEGGPRGAGGSSGFVPSRENAAELMVAAPRGAVASGF